MKYVTPGTITAVLSIAAVVAGAFGHAALAHFFDDPSTAQDILLVIGNIGTLAAGLLSGVQKDAQPK
jgi:hypothetical protein